MAKAGKNENTAVKPSKVVIRNWDEWFAMCGTMVQDLKDYESCMQKYYFDLQYDKSAASQQEAQLAYQAKHKKRFFDNEPKIPAWMLKSLFILGIVGVVLGFVLMAVIGVMGASKSGLGMAAYWAEKGTTFGRYVLVRGLILGIVLAVAFVFGRIQIHKMQLESIFKKMRAIEDRLDDKIRYIPPKYRNSQAIDVFYDLYCSYGVVTFNQAISTCDEYLVSKNLVGAYMAIMFDLPYNNGPSAESDGRASNDRGLYTDGEEINDPALPDDIKSKTFSGVDDPDAKLNELVGLVGVKTQIQQMKNRMNFHGSQSSESLSGNHMVFLGPPGTGKTTIARIITRILYDFGYIRENKCVEIDGGYLKSPYAGQTAKRANAILRYAMGGVLFIDEAYILTEDKANAQGAEAVGVLLKAMEDHKSDFVCIMAGYEDNINRMLASNEGFASRVKYKIYFENFTTEEMGQIFRNLMRSSSVHRYKIDKDAFDLLLSHFEKERRIPGFGNARVVRTAWDSILDVHADAFMRKEIPEEQKFVITKQDVQNYINVRQKQMVEDGRNFIASRNLDSTVISLQELKQKTKPGSEHPDDDLNALTGLDVVKDEIKRMKAQFSFYDGNMENNGNHMVFLGPPGTGKTTVASIMTGYLYQMGIIQENSYLDINGDFLRGMYLGHTGKRTEAVVQYSQGMVLFIDEAYLLTSNDGTADAFGQEAVGVLLDAMEKYRKNFVVIFAGYDREMNNFLDMNSGLRSRISLEFHFQSYTPHELAQMFRNVAKDHGFTVASDVWVPMQRYFKTQVTDPLFGNGRFVRQFFEEVKKSHIMNYANGMYDETNKFVIQLDDVTPLFAPPSQKPMMAEEDTPLEV